MVHFITPEISITVRRNTVTLGIKGNTNNDKFGPAEMKIVSATLEKLAIDSQYSEFVFDVSKLEHFTQDELAYRLNHIWRFFLKQNPNIEFSTIVPEDEGCRDAYELSGFPISEKKYRLSDFL